jgi:caa(3)-type oxidase subunit IV
MADENKKPEEEHVETVHVDASPRDEGVAVTPEYNPQGEAAQLQPQTALEEGVQAGLQAAADAEDNPVVEAFDDAVKGVMKAAETLAEGGETITEHHYSDTFTVPVFGQMTLPGGIYTFIFAVLAVLTVIEVLVSFVNVVSLRVVVLLVIAFAKALLVIAFYMHLNRDNWLFRFVLAVPFFVTLVSVMFLLGLPSTGYSIFAAP